MVVWLLERARTARRDESARAARETKVDVDGTARRGGNAGRHGSGVFL